VIRLVLWGQIYNALRSLHGHYRRLAKANVGAKLLCFCLECEHAGLRVMRGHIESQKLVVTSAVAALVMSPKSAIADNGLNMNTG